MHTVLRSTKSGNARHVMVGDVQELLRAARIQNLSEKGVYAQE